MSLSTNTGTAPSLVTAMAHDMIVKVGMITWSPSPIPRACTATSSAAVPLDTEIPYFRPAAALIFFSNSLTKGPSEEIQPVSIHSHRYFFSFPFNKGSFTGINSIQHLYPPSF